jgi:hypothetical protein
MNLDRFDFTKYRLKHGFSHAEAGVALEIRHARRIVSARHVWEEWPLEDWARIRDARSRYEAGQSEMCQGRHGDHFVLYEFPRKKTAPRRAYFSRWGNGIEPE